MNPRHVAFLVLLAVNTATAQSIGTDFVPLALGNEWTYRYLAIQDNVEYQTALGDSGRASYLVLTREATPDSIVWGIRSVEYSTPGIVGSSDRTYHQLVTQTILSAGPTGAPVGPNDFLLENNYPNPFNPSTVLSFSLGARERVTMTIVDILGRPITTLLDEIVEAGKHTVTWDAFREASGTYFCVAKTSRMTRCLRLLLLK
jgi:hypothetical protein